MAYKKCPRCGLNYILEQEPLCKVCLSESKKIVLTTATMETEDEHELCPECGERPVKPGEELCAQCLAEQGTEDPDEEDDWDPYQEEPDEEEEPDAEESVEDEDGQSEGLISLSQIKEEEDRFDDEEEDL